MELPIQSKPKFTWSTRSFATGLFHILPIDHAICLPTDQRAQRRRDAEPDSTGPISRNSFLTSETWQSKFADPSASRIGNVPLSGVSLSRESGDRLEGRPPPVRAEVGPNQFDCQKKEISRLKA
jgi:hypothetical protein